MSRQKRKNPLCELDGTPLYIIAADGCWTWTGSKHPLGYGMAKALGERYAHRVSYRLHRGPIPEGLTIDHLCRNRSCVNPAHLEVVSLAENIRRAPRSKLSAEQVDEIRRTTGRVSNKRLAEKFGVSRTAIYFVRKGKNWK